MKTSKQGSDAQAMQMVALAWLTRLQARRRRIWESRLAVAGILLLIIALVWVGGNLYGTHFVLQGQQFSTRSTDLQLGKVLQKQAAAYRLHLIWPDKTRHDFTLQDIGLHVDTVNSIAIVRERQQTLASRLKWWQSIPVQLVIATDSKTLQTFIAQHATITTEPPHDASLAITDGTVQLTDAIPGKQYGLDNPIRNILDTASTLQPRPLRMHIVTQQPAITTQALASVKAKLEITLAQSIVFTVDGEQVRPDRAEISNWVILTPDQPNKTVNIGVNTDNIQAYVDQIAKNHNHPARAQVTLSSGGIIPGSAGVTVLNTQAAVATLSQNLLNGKGQQVDLPVRNNGFQTISAAGAGKWIEVDLTNKRLYAYQDASLLRTFLVSAGAPATPTPTGTYAIYSKYTQQTMSGPNADGTRYVQPNVPWVNYFHSDFAIHGNYWRPSSYFGNINSSHGCVGLRTSDASWVYNWAAVGTTVVIHK